MRSNTNILTHNITAELQRRLDCTLSEQQVPAAICSAYLAQGVDVRSVSREEIKRLLVRAVRYWRNLRASCRPVCRLVIPAPHTDTVGR